MFLLDFLCNDCKQIILEVSYIHVGGECLRSGHILQQLPIAQQLTQEQTATTFRQASSNQLTHYSMSHQWMVIQVFIGYCSTTLANNYSFISHNDYISLNILGASGNFISRPHLYNSAQLYSTTFSRTLQSSTEDASCRSPAELAYAFAAIFGYPDVQLSAEASGVLPSLLHVLGSPSIIAGLRL